MTVSVREIVKVEILREQTGSSGSGSSLVVAVQAVMAVQQVLVIAKCPPAAVEFVEKCSSGKV